MQILEVTEPFEIETRQQDESFILADDELLIGIKRVGICGSDVHIYSGHNPFAAYPRIIGHEIAGVVEWVGAGAGDFAVGDHVVVNPATSCGVCDACRRGHVNTCSNLEVLGVHRDGGFCSKFVAKASWVYKISRNLDWDTAVLVEPFTIGANVTDRINVQADDRVLVVGAGVIGAISMMVAKMKGATVTVADIVEGNLEKAGELGADYLVDTTKKSLQSAVQEYTGGDGFTAIIDAACVPGMFMELLECAASGGRIGLLGFSQDISEITQYEITRKELTIAGSRLSNNQFANVIEWFESGVIQPDGIINQVAGFDEAVEVIENQYAGKLGFGKNIISFEN